MKKTFVVLLLLVGVFLIGNAEMAFAQCMYHQDYQCSGIEREDGEVSDIYTTCVGFCYNDTFEVGMYGEWFWAYLYPLDGKHLLGTADTTIYYKGYPVRVYPKT